MAETKPGKTRVLFLGNNYNPFSISCLTELIQVPDVEVFVGIYHPANKGLMSVVQKAWKQHGLAFLVRRFLELLLSVPRIWMRRLSVRLAGFRSLEEIVLTYRLSTLEFRSVNSPEAIKRLGSICPDIIAVAAFSQILKQQVIVSASKACINVHPSLLPKYRGPNPFYWVLHNGEVSSGVTVHHIDEGIDSGEIILQEKILVPPGMTEQGLRDESCRMAARLLCEAVALIMAGNAPRISQDQSEATYYPLPSRGASRL